MQQRESVLANGLCERVYKRVCGIMYFAQSYLLINRLIGLTARLSK